MFVYICIIISPVVVVLQSLKIDQIMSPNYPKSYPHHAYEAWFITAPSGSIVKLQFQAFVVSSMMIWDDNEPIQSDTNY